MPALIEKHREDILGTLSGWDRILFRGAADAMGYVRGMDLKLRELGVRYDGYYDFAKRVSKGIANRRKRSRRRRSGRWCI